MGTYNHLNIFKFSVLTLSISKKMCKLNVIVVKLNWASENRV